MSRRHGASRRRNYGRRQHEIRERRGGFADERDRPERDRTEGWFSFESGDDTPPTGLADRYGGGA